MMYTVHTTVSIVVMQVVTQIPLGHSQHTANHHQENHYQPNIHNNYAIQECTFVQRCLQVNLGATYFLERLEAVGASHVLHAATHCITLHHTASQSLHHNASQERLQAIHVLHQGWGRVFLDFKKVAKHRQQKKTSHKRRVLSLPSTPFRGR